MKGLCRKCGLACNALTCIARFGHLPKSPSFEVSTFWKGDCICCGRKDVMCTEERDFYYPSLTLINKKEWRKELLEGKDE